MASKPFYRIDVNLPDHPVLRSAKQDDVSQFSSEMSRWTNDLRINIDEALFRVCEILNRLGEDGGEAVPSYNFEDSETINFTVNGDTVSASVVGQVKGDKGDKGEPGDPGISGYTPIKGVDYFDGRNGDNGSDGADGVDGTDGVDGVDGVDGTNGTNGTNGVSVTGASIDEDGHLILTLSAGDPIDAGPVKPTSASATAECDPENAGNILISVTLNYTP